MERNLRPDSLERIHHLPGEQLDQQVVEDCGIVNGNVSDPARR